MATTVTSQIEGITISEAMKAPCAAVATSNITLSGLQTVGSVSLAADDRVLVMAQTDATENGIYNASTGSWQRAKDFDGNRDVVKGTLVILNDGAGSIYYRVTTSDPIVIGTSSINFEVVSGVLTQSIIGGLLYPPIAAESGVTVVNSFYPYGYVYRYGTNSVPGTTDMTVAHQAAATVAKALNCAVVLGVNCLITGSLDFSQLRVIGPGAADPNTNVYNIVASSAQFDVIVSQGQSVFEDFSVNGGWDTVTAGQNGNIFKIQNAGSPFFAYNVHFRNVRVQNAKRSMIYVVGGGYSSIWAFRGLNAGLHGLEISDGGGALVSTTYVIGGQSVFGNTPNGYGSKITNGVSISFRDVIMEVTKGIQLVGINHRSLVFDNVYQELTSGGLFLDGNGSGGIGLQVINCYGAGAAIANLTGWEDVAFQSNSNLGEPPIPLANSVMQADGGENLTSTTGGVNVTAAQIALGAGVWLILGTVQTITSTASTLTQAACQLTTNSAASGLNNATNSGFGVGADQANYNPGASLDQRLNCSTIVSLAAGTTYYLRTRLVFSGAGNLAYHGYINAVKIH